MMLPADCPSRRRGHRALSGDFDLGRGSLEMSAWMPVDLYLWRGSLEMSAWVPVDLYLGREAARDVCLDSAWYIVQCRGGSTPETRGLDFDAGMVAEIHHPGALPW